jgi:helix-turn-helix protein
MRRKRTSDVLRRSAGERSFEHPGASTTLRRGARRVRLSSADPREGQAEARGWSLTGAEPRSKGKMPTVEEEPTRGPLAGQSGWVTTKVAAQALRVDPRTVRKYINQGKLEARVEGEGVEKTYMVSIDSVYSLRGSRPDPRPTRDDSPRESAGSTVSEDLVALVRELTTEVARRSSESAELRTRLELTERAESSLREALEQRLETEQILREQTERERDELRAQLGARESPLTSPEGSGGGEEAPRGRPPWWRRIFGLPREPPPPR